ncbi:unnamed protein product [Rotaria sp. Silwood2]|nr:unnamed protein product [Rotaria sp. Silwood2]
MSRIIYNNNESNQIQPISSLIPNKPRYPNIGYSHRNNNKYNNQYRNYNINPNNIYNSKFYRRNYINQNFQQNYRNVNRRNTNDYHVNSYSYENNRRGSMISSVPEQRKSGKNQRMKRSISRQRQGRTSKPGQLQLNDYMPPQLRVTTSIGNIPNLPLDFTLTNLDTTMNARSNLPGNILTQRPNYTTQAITTNDTTQPFVVCNDLNENINEQQLQHNNNQQLKHNYNQPERPTIATTTTTTSYRRRQRRIRQRQQRQNYHDINNENHNRFNILEKIDTSTDTESDYENQAVDDVLSIVDNDSNYNNENQSRQQNKWNQINNRNNDNKNNDNFKKIKQKIYLEPNRIMRYMQDNVAVIMGSRGNQAYVLAATPLYDEWIRNNYELQVWQTYQRMGIQDKHWAKEVVTRTKKRDNIINSRFIQKKINRLTNNIAQTNAQITNLQIQLNTYWTQTTAGTMNTTMTSNAPLTTAPGTNTNRIRDAVDRLEKTILQYIQHCTQHVKNMSENKIRLAQIQIDEYKALEDFKEIANPNQWNIHLMLKSKMKQWSTKNKNYITAAKRIEYDLPPKFISSASCTFKIDESIVSKEEAQILYDQMRQLTKDYRMQAMSIYLRAMTREKEILKNEIDNIIKGFTQENTEDYDIELDSGYIAFKYYNELREKRLNLEAQKAGYFLEEQRVEGDQIEEEETTVAPTLTRSLGEDFLLQI